MSNHPRLIILSAPSGAGKTTLCDQLLMQYPEIVYSVSVTTREPRGAEEDGEDYHFVTEEGFLKRVRQGDFLEHAHVHGHRYGTLKAPIYDAFREGHSVLMDIDIAGAERVRTYCRDCPETDLLHDRLVDIFILPPSIDTLRERLETRREDSPATIDRRLFNAEVEMRDAPKFRYRIVNDSLAHALREIQEILEIESTGDPRREAPPCGI